MRATIGLRHRTRSEHQTMTGSEGEGGLSDATTGSMPQQGASKKGPGVLKRRKSIRPMAGRKNKEGREKAIKDHREVHYG